jgi:hypothetical protein
MQAGGWEGTQVGVTGRQHSGKQRVHVVGARPVVFARETLILISLPL